MNGTIPPAIKNPAIKHTQIFIGNQWLNSVDGSTFETINPATEEKIADVSEAKQADVDAAVSAAKEAFAPGSIWRRMKFSERGRLLAKVAELIERDAQYIASLETLNNGRLYSATYGDAFRIAQNFRYFAGWTDKNHGKTIPFDGDFFCYTNHEPVGICAAIVPWNVPLVMFSWKVAPCLAMGNVMIFKPAEQTPLTALYLASLFKEAGFPPGVLNIVPGFGAIAGKALSHHMHIDKLAFTGSNGVGRLIMRASADSNCKRLTVEMGGKSPNVVFPDVDVEQAVKISQVAIFRNSGQICCSGSRTFVHEDIYDEFVKRCIDEAKKLQVGDPHDLTTRHSPVINKAQEERILRYIDIAVKEGGKIVYGGKKIEGIKGFYIQPTVITDLTDEMTISQEEIFGPVQQIYKFRTVDEVIERANNTRFGLAAGVITNDVNNIMAVTRGVKAGIIWVNCYYPMSPGTAFGGCKESGYGRELGEYALEHYSEVKTVIMKIPAQ